MKDLDLKQLFSKIENCNKWIKIHKENRTNPDFDVSFCNAEIIRLTNMKKEYQSQFDKLYDQS